MNFLEDLIKESRQSNRMKCSVAVLLATFPVDLVEDLHRALADPRVNSSVLARKLTDMGHEVSQQTVARHRRAACSCRPPRPEAESEATLGSAS